MRLILINDDGDEILRGNIFSPEIMIEEDVDYTDVFADDLLDAPRICFRGPSRQSFTLHGTVVASSNKPSLIINPALAKEAGMLFNHSRS